jgi:hypothetical protein
VSPIGSPPTLFSGEYDHEAQHDQSIGEIGFGPASPGADVGVSWDTPEKGRSDGRASPPGNTSSSPHPYKGGVGGATPPPKWKETQGRQAFSAASPLSADVLSFVPTGKTNQPSMATTATANHQGKTDEMVKSTRNPLRAGHYRSRGKSPTESAR